MVVGGLPAALQEVQRAGVWVVGLDATSEQSLFGLDLLTEPVAIVIGAGNLWRGKQGLEPRRQQQIGEHRRVPPHRAGGRRDHGTTERGSSS